MSENEQPIEYKVRIFEKKQESVEKDIKVLQRSVARLYILVEIISKILAEEEIRRLK